MRSQKVIIIGSGLGGLVCGYILAKNGFQVTILEKNRQIGGCLQTFQRGGVKFDTGMHYIGSMDEGQILHRLFRYLDLLKDVKISRLNPNGYDLISIEGDEYRLASGAEAFIETLAEKFPEERQNIRNWVQSVEKIALASPLYNLHNEPSPFLLNVDYYQTSVNDFIAAHTANSRLQNVLAGNVPLYAGVKNSTSTYIHALINYFYMQSAFRIVGGSDCIARSLAQSIERFGGTILTNAEVRHIGCDSEQAINVELTNNEQLTADFFISNVHPQATMNLIDSPLIRKVYRQRIQNIQNTISNFTVYLRFKPQRVPYMNHNYYFYEHNDVWVDKNYDLQRYPESYLYMHQCPSEQPVFAESAEVIAYMNFSETARWANTRVGNRGTDYEQFKQEKAQQILQKLAQSFPGILDDIEAYYTSSPLTYRDYTATTDGSMYGIIRDVNQPLQSIIAQRTKIPNLFLTGQNINSHGILGTTFGAMLTCSELVGMTTITQEIE